MRSSTLEHWQESRNNYLSIFSYVAINFNHSPTPHFHSPQSSQSKSWLNQIDKQLIRWRHQAAEAGKVIKGLQLLRAKRFQVNVAGDFAFCHLEDAGHTVVAAEHLVPGGLGRGTADLGRQQKDGQGLMDGQDFATKCHLQKVIQNQGKALSHSLHLSCAYSTIELLRAFWLVDFRVGSSGPMLLEFMGTKSFLFSSTKVHGFFQSSSSWAQCSKARAMVKVSQLCPTLCDLMDYTVHRILRPEYWSV